MFGTRSGGASNGETRVRVAPRIRVTPNVRAGVFGTALEELEREEAETMGVDADDLIDPPVRGRGATNGGFGGRRANDVVFSVTLGQNSSNGTQNSNGGGYGGGGARRGGGFRSGGGENASNFLSRDVDRDNNIGGASRSGAGGFRMGQVGGGRRGQQAGGGRGRAGWRKGRSGPGGSFDKDMSTVDLDAQLEAHMAKR